MRVSVEVLRNSDFDSFGIPFSDANLGPAGGFGFRCFAIASAHRGAAAGSGFAHDQSCRNRPGLPHDGSRQVPHSETIIDATHADGLRRGVTRYLYWSAVAPMAANEGRPATNRN